MIDEIVDECNDGCDCASDEWEILVVGEEFALEVWDPVEVWTHTCMIIYIC